MLDLDDLRGQEILDVASGTADNDQAVPDRKNDFVHGLLAARRPENACRMPLAKHILCRVNPNCLRCDLALPPEISNERRKRAVK